MGCTNVPSVMTSQSVPRVKCDVSTGPMSLQLKTKSIVEICGSHAEPIELLLGVGKYVIGEALKNLYTKDFQGKLKVFGKQHMLLAEKTS